MTLATHAVIGAIIASKFPEHPVLGFGLAFASHFVLDAIPHWDYRLSTLQENEDDLMKNRMPISVSRKFMGDLLKTGIDCILGIMAALLLFWDKNPVVVLAGAVGGVLPDALQFIYFHIQKEPLVALQRFHMLLHTRNKMKSARILSIISQVILVAGTYFIFFF